MSLLEDYRQQAVDCFNQSQSVSDLQSKFLLLQLAQAWVDLAEQVARVSDAGVRLRAVAYRTVNASKSSLHHETSPFVVIKPRPGNAPSVARAHS
jgi:hypothetical protein